MSGREDDPPCPLTSPSTYYGPAGTRADRARGERAEQNRIIFDSVGK